MYPFKMKNLLVSTYNRLSLICFACNCFFANLVRNGAFMIVKIHKTERLLSGFFDVDKATLQYERFNGEFSEIVPRYNLLRGQAVAVLIYLEDTEQLVLIRQFRYAVYKAGGDGWITETVAGVIDAGESPETCAKRECIEESGFKLNRLEKIATVFSTPGITTEQIHIFLGISTSKDQIHAGGGLEEEHEDIQLLYLTKNEAARALKEQRFNDAKTILALQYFLLNAEEFQLNKTGA